MSLFHTLREFQAAPDVKAWLPGQRRIIDTLLQRAEGLIEGWSHNERIGEGLAAVKEVGKAILMGLDQDEAFAYEVRAMRALRKLFREEPPRDLSVLPAGLDDHLKPPLR